MECIIGIKFSDFVMIAADMTTAHSVMVMKCDENKIYPLSDKLVMAIVGEKGDTTQFAEYIAKNVQLYKMRNGYELSPQAAANFTRRNLAEALRSRNAYYVNLMLAGHDEQKGPELFFMDHLASLAPVKYAAHGYGGFFSLAIIDRYHLESLTKEQAYELMKKCVAEIQQRLFINLSSFKVQVVDANGIHDCPDITAKSLVLEK